MTGTGTAQHRKAFTLLEMLIVILIIAALSSILLGAVTKVMEKMTEVGNRTEISELDGALAAFMADYNLQNPPPSYLLLREDGKYNLANPPEAFTAQWLTRWLGRSFSTATPCDWNGNGVIDPPYVLQGQQCLVFFCGGIPQTSNGVLMMSGFNPLNAAPASTGTIQRKGPYMSFQSSRLVMLPSCPGFPVYLDDYSSVSIGRGHQTPYAYFSSEGNYGGYNQHGNGLFSTISTGGDCSVISAYVWTQGLSTTGVLQYMNPNKYQILSAGKDGVFASDLSPLAAATTYWNPYTGDMTGVPSVNPVMSARATSRPVGWDDQSNFSSTLLGVGQH